MPHYTYLIVGGGMTAEEQLRYRDLYERGARGSTSHALGNAVMHGDGRMARWLLENAKPDLSWKNYEGKDLLTIARETGKQEMLDLLREFHIT